MADNTETRSLTVNELKDKCFHIPSYQRGYRWTKSEIWALLDDVFDFKSKDGERYCLQPLIVKKHDTENHYDVIDGQQRLTTIFIALLCTLKHRPTMSIPYSIDYDTRCDSKRFLEELSENSKNEAETNIDFHYMYDAWMNIHSWIVNRTEADRSQQEANIAGTLMDKLTGLTEFIWYEMPANEEPIELFAKENTGKIPLTSAELIKALLLCDENFVPKIKTDKSKDELKKHQIAMSIIWDRMERRLRDDSFWYFLCEREDEEKPVETRIDLVFEVLARHYYEEYKEISDLVQDPYDPYFPFHVLSKRIELHEKLKHTGKPGQNAVQTIWDDAQHCFAHLENWYDDFRKYHLIGYLVAVAGTKDRRNLLCDIWKEAMEKKKSVLDASLDGKVRKTLNDIGSLDELDYDKNKEQIRKILLLFNILSLFPNDRSKNDEGQYRFPFDRYKKEKWDIEHIHSVHETLPRERGYIREYLESLAESLEAAREEGPATEIRDFLSKSGPESLDTKKAKELYEKLREKFSDVVDLSVDNRIRNLTLLDAGTNRSYGNAMFFTKRKEILKQEKAGRFVPLCTKNVFLKLYSDKPKNLYRWNLEHDRDKYVEAIRETLGEYLHDEGGTK